MSNQTAIQTVAALRSVIESAILNSPRSRQRALGPSEIGNACDRCLVHMVNFAYCSGDGSSKPVESTIPWLPFIGTSVHAELQRIVDEHGGPDWKTENRVTVGMLDDEEISGSTDVFHVPTGTVIDYKVVGKTTLDKVKFDGRGCSLTYQRQGHTYGKGWEDKGYKVNAIAIWFMPRNGMSLAQGRLFTDDYDRQVAVDSLARAERFKQWIDEFGFDAVLAATPPHTGTEFSCSKFDGPQGPASTRSLLAA